MIVPAPDRETVRTAAIAFVLLLLPFGSLLLLLLLRFRRASRDRDQRVTRRWLRDQEASEAHRP